MAKHIATYLNDHLAGSVVTLELLEHALRKIPASPSEPTREAKSAKKTTAKKANKKR